MAEDWDFVDEREPQGWKGSTVYMDCLHFFTESTSTATQWLPAGSEKSSLHRRPSEEEVQALGSYVAEGDGLGS